MKKSQKLKNQNNKKSMKQVNNNSTRIKNKFKSKMLIDSI